jgi:hypothetical protein
MQNDASVQNINLHVICMFDGGRTSASVRTAAAGRREWYIPVLVRSCHTARYCISNSDDKEPFFNTKKRASHWLKPRNLPYVCYILCHPCAFTLANRQGCIEGCIGC